ncbi:MAG: hypothetical protein B6U94_03985 [Thermofilum sp. ex4484_79]|nr:MAG: hypothetical protein B6U94_03985 [Thermofilum sp. ex4484_79]
MGDLQGSSVRVSRLKNPITLHKGLKLSFMLADKSPGKYVLVFHNAFFEIVKKGDVVLADDRKISLGL